MRASLKNLLTRNSIFSTLQLSLLQQMTPIYTGSNFGDTNLPFLLL